MQGWVWIEISNSPHPLSSNFVKTLQNLFWMLEKGGCSIRFGGAWQRLGIGLVSAWQRLGIGLVSAWHRLGIGLAKSQANLWQIF